jgi:signal transduction histidine kinase
MTASPQLAQRIRDRKSAIVERWDQLVRVHHIARSLPEPVLRDSMPQLLERLADAASEERQEPVDVGEPAAKHAAQRLTLGFELGELVEEYADLRTALFDVVVGEGIDAASVAEWRLIDCTIDNAVGRAVERFSRVREQKLRAFERVSSEALTAGDLSTLLGHLLGAMAEVAPEVDTVTILLREGSSLQVRASRGLEEEIRRGFSLAIGEGFAGTIAATRRPLLIHDAAHDARVKSEVVRERGMRAMYGVPLLDERQGLVGVAHMGSRTAYEFQDEDLILFGALASRATALIVSRRTTDVLIENERQRDGFIGILAHDLRSPLQAVVGSAHMLLEQGRLDDRDRRIVARIARAADRMGRLVSDTLDFARARLGSGMPLTLERIDLAEVVRTAAEEAELGHPGGTVRMKTTLSERVWADADRVAQLVSNLLDNALKHGSPVGVVDVRVFESDGDAVVSVHNGGPKIPPDLLPYVFEPFRRGATGSGRGVGLGLFIANTIAAEHGGSIEAISDDTSGTSFVVRLPIEPRKK